MTIAAAAFRHTATSLWLQQLLTPIAYDPVRAETFHNFTVFTIEKNRGGPNLIDIEFRKDFLYYRFDPQGGIVAEKLIDEPVAGAAAAGVCWKPSLPRVAAAAAALCFCMYSGLLTKNW